MGKRNLVDEINTILSDRENESESKIFLVDEETMGDLKSREKIGGLNVRVISSQKEADSYSLEKIGGTNVDRVKIRDGNMYVLDMEGMRDGSSFVDKFVAGRFYSQRHNTNSKVVVLRKYYEVDEWFVNNDKLDYLVKNLVD